MRAIPVDTTRITLIGTGKLAERAEYVALSDGSRKRSGQQAKDDGGMPLWTVDVLVDDPDADRAEIASVKIASWDPPVTEKLKPVRFRNLVAIPWIAEGSRRVSLSFRADGLEGAPAKPAGQAAA